MCNAAGNGTSYCLNPVTSSGCTSGDIGASANVELAEKFSYLGDMLSMYWDADGAVETFSSVETYLTETNTQKVSEVIITAAVNYSSYALIKRSNHWAMLPYIEAAGFEPASPDFKQQIDQFTAM